MEMMTRMEFLGGVAAATCMVGCKTDDRSDAHKEVAPVDGAKGDVAKDDVAMGDVAMGDGAMGDVAMGDGAFSFAVLAPESISDGAGLCVVMRTPAGKTYLFDTANGDFRGKSPRNNGRDIIAPWLRAHGVTRIDGLIISHYHADHFGGFLWLMDNFPIKRVYNNDYLPPFDRLTAHDLDAYIVARRALDRWGAMHPGRLVDGVKSGIDLGWNEKDVSFDVVWPQRRGYVQGGDFDQSLNANSTALRVTAFGKVFFIMGDVQADCLKTYMRPALAYAGKWGCDVAVLPAHGTRSAEVLPEIMRMNPRPKSVIASLGDRPWMRRCSNGLMKRYASAGFAVYSTNLYGNVCARFTPDAAVAR